MSHRIYEKSSNTSAILLALSAAAFFAINTPFSKKLLEYVAPTFMAAFLYMGAGLGIGIMFLFNIRKEKSTERLTKKDLPYTIGMIALDIAAPILLMIGIQLGNASNASLLGNFEIVATTLIALLIFKEKITNKLWIAIGFITVSSIFLSFEGSDSIQLSIGSLFVILATCCWGLENNCTRKISDKSTYEIVLLKGVFSGGGSLIIALILGEKFPKPIHIVTVMVLGYVAYGLSIFLYIRAQRMLGAAKTSAYYAVAPFISALLAFIINGEQLTVLYFGGLFLMIIGTIFVVYDTLLKHHLHSHTHIIIHTHDGTTHSHTIVHEHEHNHLGNDEKHIHRHSDYMDSEEHKLAHSHIA